MKIDLHMHSTASDGKLSPSELVDWAIERGMRGIAITDHEVVDGSREAVEYAKGKDIEVVTGIEVGVDVAELGLRDVHVLGYFLDLENEGLVELSGKLMRAREVQKREMIERLNKMGYEITFEELRKEAGGVNYGRSHIARILLRRYDEFESFRDVFDKLLGHSGAANVWQWKDTMERTVEVIHGAGGIAALAHPMLCDDFEKVVDRFVECGGDGLEADYFYGNRGAGAGKKSREEDMGIEKVREIAREKGLVVSGGGDFHVVDDPCEIGNYGVTLREFERLKECWRLRNGFKVC